MRLGVGECVWVCVCVGGDACEGVYIYVCLSRRPNTTIKMGCPKIKVLSMKCRWNTFYSTSTPFCQVLFELHWTCRKESMFGYTCSLAANLALVRWQLMPRAWVCLFVSLVQELADITKVDSYNHALWIMHAYIKLMYAQWNMVRERKKILIKVKKWFCFDRRYKNYYLKQSLCHCWSVIDEANDQLLILLEKVSYTRIQ